MNMITKTKVCPQGCFLQNAFDEFLVIVDELPFLANEALRNAYF